MATPEVEELGDDRFLLDLDFRDTEGLVASYLLPLEDGWMLIETGPSSCRDALLQGISSAGVSPLDIRRILVTHVHLDHAGGLGAVAERFPRAQLYVHHEGRPHLVDPARLIESARRAWGASADSLWGPIVPVPEERLIGLRGGEALPVKGGSLRVLATPGHAKHHLAAYDERTGALFVGDAAGVRLPGTGRARPALPPPDLDLELLMDSLEEMKRLGPRRLLYSHFGARPDAPAELESYARVVESWRGVALGAAREEPTVEYVAQALDQLETEAARPVEIAERSGRQAELISGTAMAAQGLLRYFRTRGLIDG